MTGSYGLASGCLSFGGEWDVVRVSGSTPRDGGVSEGGDDEMGEGRIVH